jgi:hypothetical protein
MKNFSVKEIESLNEIVNDSTLNKLEFFLINTNLSKEERIKLVQIIHESVLDSELRKTINKVRSNPPYSS